MHKIVMAADGLHLTETFLDYGIFFARQSGGHLVGAFLRDIGYTRAAAKKLRASAAMWSDGHQEMSDPPDEIFRKLACELFENKLRATGIRFSVHHDKPIALQALHEESNFADLVLLDVHNSFSNYDTDQPSRFLRDALAGIHCPVVITPGTFNRVEHVVFVYDGEPASVYAIRQFSYLFPESGDIKYEIVYIAKKGETSQIPNYKLLQELLSYKFDRIKLTLLTGNNNADALADYMLTIQQNSMLVVGAYGRSAVSRRIQPSILDTAINRLSIPLFVTHAW